jgi:hypothetical protein
MKYNLIGDTLKCDKYITFFGIGVGACGKPNCGYWCWLKLNPYERKLIETNNITWAVQNLQSNNYENKTVAKHILDINK